MAAAALRLAAWPVGGSVTVTHLEPWVMLYNTLGCYLADPPQLHNTEGYYTACYEQVLYNTTYEQELFNML